MIGLVDEGGADGIYSLQSSSQSKLRLPLELSVDARSHISEVHLGISAFHPSARHLLAIGPTRRACPLAFQLHSRPSTMKGSPFGERFRIYSTPVEALLADLGGPTLGAPSEMTIENDEGNPSASRLD